MQVSLNQNQKLFVLNHGKGVSCQGFDYTFRQLQQLQTALAKFDIQIGDVLESEIGTLKQYQQYQDAIAQIGSRDLGTWFDPDTPEKVKRVLESCRKKRNVVRVFFGNPETGLDGLEEYDVVGHIGRSSGVTKVPLLVPLHDNGGPALSTSRIVRILDVESGRVLYTHPKWHLPVMEIVSDTEYKEYSHAVNVSGSLHARFPDYAAAAHWVAFMAGRCHNLPE